MPTFTNDQATAILQGITPGTKVAIMYHNVRDPENIIKFAGVLLKKGTGWIVKKGATCYRCTPSDYAVIHGIEELEASSRSASVRHEAELNYEDADGASPLGEQRRQGQPTINGFTARNDNERIRKSDSPSDDARDGNFVPTWHGCALSDARAADRNHQGHPSRGDRGTSSPSHHRSGGARRRCEFDSARRRPQGSGQPHLAFAPGLLLPKFIPERFRIFSILHLIFQQDPVTQEMVKVPKGTALPAYLNFLPAAKLSFPNQVPFRISN